MEKNFVWFQDWNQQSPNFSSLGAILNRAQHNINPAYMKPYATEVSPNGSYPSHPFARLPHSMASHQTESSNWFYSLPRSRQACAPVLNSIPKKEQLGGTVGKIGGNGTAAFGAGCPQKRFLVFDQSRDQTTLLYSSDIGTPVPYLNSLKPKVPVSHNWLKEEPGINKDTLPTLGLSLGDKGLADEYDEGNQKDDAESEMHEDTEELNALLYSDDDYGSDTDEETSTGHSPSNITANWIQDWFEAKDVASSAGSTKRQKLFDGYNAPSIGDSALMDTASSLKCAALSELEDDAESSCANSSNQVSRGFSSLSGKKRSRSETIRETIRIFQDVIPNGKGKDTMFVIDEAIHYLKSLKAKAKDLGLDTL